jgi:hypothetical protein
VQREGVTSDYNKYNPDHRQIYKFIRTLFNAAQLTAECAIITLVYLERQVFSFHAHLVLYLVYTSFLVMLSIRKFPLPPCEYQPMFGRKV